jgi:CheY-like chemotaxis protein
MDGDAEGILAAGIDRYLTKPLRRSAILEEIEAQRPADAYSLVADTAPQLPDSAP